MRIAILLAVMLAMSGPASAVVGDLNRDGVVDLKDFFMLADNFGLENALRLCPLFLPRGPINSICRELEMPRITPLKQEIVRRRLIQADVAHDAGLTEYRMSRIVNGRVQATDAEKKHLARALAVRTEELPL